MKPKAKKTAPLSNSTIGKSKIPKKQKDGNFAEINPDIYFDHNEGNTRPQK